MNYFRVMPAALGAQREELDGAYRELCQDVAELGGVIRQLGTMSGFGDVIHSLRRVRQKGTEQQAKLRQCARVLEQISELYTWTELRNMDGEVHEAIGVPAEPARRALETVPAPLEMVPHPEALFGMRVSIPRRDGEGG